MVIAIDEDMFTPEVIADPYTYYGRLREEDPVHWNELYEMWAINSRKVGKAGGRDGYRY